LRPVGKGGFETVFNPTQVPQEKVVKELRRLMFAAAFTALCTGAVTLLHAYRFSGWKTFSSEVFKLLLVALTVWQALEANEDKKSVALQFASCALLISIVADIGFLLAGR
jgi:hypothetical protein